MLNVELENRMYRDIQERAFDFACCIVRLHAHLIRKSGAARSLARQVLKAGTSIGANLEEASAGQSKADFISKCSIAAKEARETHYWLRLLSACNVLPASGDPLLKESDELVAILTSIVKNAGISPSRGS